jgi:hypothetical protein
MQLRCSSTPLISIVSLSQSRMARPPLARDGAGVARRTCDHGRRDRRHQCRGRVRAARGGARRGSWRRRCQHRVAGRSPRGQDRGGRWQGRRSPRLGQIDQAVEEAAKRGRTNATLSAIEGSVEPVGASWMSETERPALCVAALKAERAQVTAKGRQAETEAAPIRYVACDLRHRRSRDGDAVAHRPDGAHLRSAGDCADGRRFGTAINLCLKPFWSVAPSLAAVPRGSRGAAPRGHNRTHAVRQRLSISCETARCGRIGRSASAGTLR